MIFYEVWSKGHAEDSEKTFVSLKREDCEEWIALHSLDCANGYYILETKASEIPLGNFAYIRGCTYNETYKADLDGYALVGIEDQMSKYRQFNVDLTYLDPQEFEKIFGNLDFDNAEKGIIFLKTKFPGEYTFLFRVPREQIRGRDYQELVEEILKIVKQEYEQQVVNKTVVVS